MPLNPPMQYSKSGLQLTENFEGCKLEAYPDPGSGGDPWTIGYGHTGPDVHPGLTWTVDQAQAALSADMNHAVNCVNALVNVTLTQGEFDALSDFAYNAGANALRGSSLLRFVNASDFTSAAGEFEKWDHASGHVLAGLLRRRQAEEKEFDPAES